MISRDTVRNGVLMQHANIFALQFQRDMKECFRMVEEVFQLVACCSTDL